MLFKTWSSGQGICINLFLSTRVLKSEVMQQESFKPSSDLTYELLDSLDGAMISSYEKTFKKIVPSSSHKYLINLTKSFTEVADFFFFSILV